MLNHSLWNSFDNTERSFLLDVCLSEAISILGGIALILLFLSIFFLLNRTHSLNNRLVSEWLSSLETSL